MGKTKKDSEDLAKRERDLYNRRVRYRKRVQQEQEADRELKEFEKGKK